MYFIETWLYGRWRIYPRNLNWRDLSQWIRGSNLILQLLRLQACKEYGALSDDFQETNLNRPTQYRFIIKGIQFRRSGSRTRVAATPEPSQRTEPKTKRHLPFVLKKSQKDPTNPTFGNGWYSNLAREFASHDTNFYTLIESFLGGAYVHNWHILPGWLIADRQPVFIRPLKHPHVITFRPIRLS